MKSFKITAGHYFTGQMITRIVPAPSCDVAKLAVATWYTDNDYAIVSIEEMI